KMSIVIINVSQTSAPIPVNLQKKGAVLSQGGTTLPAGTAAVIRQPSDLTPLLTPSVALTALLWANGVVTATTAKAHNIPNGVILPVSTANVQPAGYNGTFPCTATGPNTFTYPLVNNPGAVTQDGAYAPGSTTEVLAAITTFFAQGSQQAAWVLELGLVSAAD